MKKIELTTRIWVLIVSLVIAVIAINPLLGLEKGVIIKSVEKNSAAERSGFVPGEIIKEIDGEKVYTIKDYVSRINIINVSPVKFSISTNESSYSYESKTLDFDVLEDNETVKTGNVRGNALVSGLKENLILISVNGIEINSSKDFLDIKNSLEPRENMFVKTNLYDYTLSLSSPPEILVGEIPLSNIKTGLDLRGGARGLVKPVEEVSIEDIQDLVLVSKERFNVYGISDVNVRPVNDLSGNNYMLVEVAGATPDDLKELISKQGKFEAKIGNEMVFIGGKNDIPSVCRNDASCATIRQCLKVEGGYNCEFSFSIYLSEDAAERQADITSGLDMNVTSSGSRYLNESLDLYLDDILTDSLLISADLKGRPTTQISISGPGFGITQQDAYDNAEKNMLKLQTVLITGSLPFKLEVVKLDSISPLLGKEFFNNILLIIIAAILSVSLIIFLRYRQLSLTIPVVITIVSELILTLGVAALINWNLDLASIAGIIAAVGTGVDDQIVIIDESRISKEYSWKERIKKALFIILSAFAITFAAMLPLWWAGAGLLKGFALTTIIGISVGVFITRPAFADIASYVSKD